MAGNAYEWTSDTIIGTNKPIGGGGAWAQWSAVSNFGSMSQATAGPLNNLWNSVQGIGQYYQGNADASTYGFIRGGTWLDVAYSGVEMLRLLRNQTYIDAYLGFRCAR